MLANQVNAYISVLELHPHPEGGFYKETYRSDDTTATPHGERNLSTAIYFLLEKGNFSAFHRIKSEEVWHFYDGDPLSVYVIHGNGTLQEIKLGLDLGKGQTPQAVVPANCWFASMVAEGGSFSLVGCTVAPGFDFRDFEMAKRTELVTDFPQHLEIISKLTRL